MGLLYVACDAAPCASWCTSHVACQAARCMPYPALKTSCERTISWMLFFSQNRSVTPRDHSTQPFSAAPRCSAECRLRHDTWHAPYERATWRTSYAVATQITRNTNVHSHTRARAHAQITPTLLARTCTHGTHAYTHARTRKQPYTHPRTHAYTNARTTTSLQHRTACCGAAQRGVCCTHRRRARVHARVLAHDKLVHRVGPQQAAHKLGAGRHVLS